MPVKTKEDQDPFDRYRSQRELDPAFFELTGNAIMKLTRFGTIPPPLKVNLFGDALTLREVEDVQPPPDQEAN